MLRLPRQVAKKTLDIINRTQTSESVHLSSDTQYKKLQISQHAKHTVYSTPINSTQKLPTQWQRRPNQNCSWYIIKTQIIKERPTSFKKTPNVIEKHRLLKTQVIKDRRLNQKRPLWP